MTGCSESPGSLFATNISKPYHTLFLGVLTGIPTVSFISMNKGPILLKYLVGDILINTKKENV